MSLDQCLNRNAGLGMIRRHCSVFPAPCLDGVLSTGVVLASDPEAGGQEETQRRKERGARCAAKVPGVIDVMAVYPSCCVATA